MTFSANTGMIAIVNAEPTNVIAGPMSADETTPACREASGLVSEDSGDLSLIDDMLALSPEERLTTLGTTLRSLEALLAATGSTAPTE